MRRGDQEKENRKGVLTNEFSESQVLPVPDFLAPFGIDEAQSWQLIPLCAQQAIWIGKEAYLGQFIEGEERWTQQTVERAVLEVYYHSEGGLALWEPLLVEESDPLAKFSNGLLSPGALEFWRGLSEAAPEVCLEVTKISPRVWTTAKELYRHRDEMSDSGDKEADTLRVATAFFSWLNWPHPPVMRDLIFPEQVVDELGSDPFGSEPQEVLAARPKFSSFVAQKTAEFFQGCSPQEWALLRFLTNRSDWERLPFWQEKNTQRLLSKDDLVLEAIRRMNVSTLEKVAVAFEAGWIPPEFLEDQAQLAWSRFPRWARFTFGGEVASTMEWLRGGGKGHFKLPKGRPSDTLIILMSHFLSDKGFDIFRGLDDVRYYLREMITGRRIVPPEGDEATEVEEPVSVLPSGAREMSAFSRPVGAVLHRLILDLWSGEKKVTLDQLGEIETGVGEIQRLTRNSFSDKVVFSDQDMEILIDVQDVGSDDGEEWLRAEQAREFLLAKRRRWLLLLEKTIGLQKQLNRALRANEESGEASIFHFLDLETGDLDSYRKQAVAVRATLAVAREVLSPLIRPEDIFVREPVVLIENESEDWLGFDVPDGLLITGLDGQKLDSEREMQLRAFVEAFPEIRAFPLKLGVDFCALVEAIKEEFGVSAVQMKFIEIKTAMGRRLNRSQRQLSRLRKSDLEMIREMTLMTAVAWQARKGKVDWRDIPETQVVYLRPFGAQRIGFRIHSHDFDSLDFDRDNSVQLGDEDQVLVAKAVGSLRRQIEKLETVRREKSRLALTQSGEPLAAVQLDSFVDLEDNGVFGPPLFSLPAVEEKTKRGRREVVRTPVPVQTLLVELDKVEPGRIVGEVVFFDKKVRA